MYKFPLVSVILPNYNHALFLEERIHSILNQTYQFFELIILDDHSSDNSIDIINKYKENAHIGHIVYNKENSGSPFKQWNKGFQLAKGDLVWIAESDDCCSPFFLEKLVLLHVKNHAVITFCRSQTMDEKGRLLTTWHNELTKDYVWDGIFFINRFLGKVNIITNASSAIFNRNLVNLIPDEYQTFKGAGDWLFWLELSRHGKVVFCSEALNYFRSHENNTTTKCYNKGTNFYEGKKINDYLFKEGLISNKVFKQNVRNNINKIRNLKFESDLIKYDLLNKWGFSINYKIKFFISKLLNKLYLWVWN